MSDNELSRVLVDILERLVRVETKIDDMRDLRDTAEAAEKTANEALQSSKSAHNRINEIRSDVTWAWRTALAAVFGAAVSLVLKLFGK